MPYKFLFASMSGSEPAEKTVELNLKLMCRITCPLCEGVSDFSKPMSERCISKDIEREVKIQIRAMLRLAETTATWWARKTNGEVWSREEEWLDEDTAELTVLRDACPFITNKYHINFLASLALSRVACDELRTPRQRCEGVAELMRTLPAVCCTECAASFCPVCLSEWEIEDGCQCTRPWRRPRQEACGACPFCSLQFFCVDVGCGEMRCPGCCREFEWCEAIKLTNAPPEDEYNREAEDKIMDYTQRVLSESKARCRPGRWKDLMYHMKLLMSKYGWGHSEHLRLRPEPLDFFGCIWVWASAWCEVFGRNEICWLCRVLPKYEAREILPSWRTYCVHILKVCIANNQDYIGDLLYAFLPRETDWVSQDTLMRIYTTCSFDAFHSILRYGVNRPHSTPTDQFFNSTLPDHVVATKDMQLLKQIKYYYTPIQMFLLLPSIPLRGKFRRGEVLKILIRGNCRGAGLSWMLFEKKEIEQVAQGIAKALLCEETPHECLSLATDVVEHGKNDQSVRAVAFLNEALRAVTLAEEEMTVCPKRVIDHLRTIAEESRLMFGK